MNTILESQCPRSLAMQAENHNRRITTADYPPTSHTGWHDHVHLMILKQDHIDGVTIRVFNKFKDGRNQWGESQQCISGPS